MYHQIIYCSKLNNAYNESEVYQIVKHARHRNRQVGITGHLTFGKQLFLQILEGYMGPITDLMHKIKEDDRHQDIKLISATNIQYLNYEKWSMGYLNLLPEHDYHEEFKPYEFSQEQSLMYLHENL